MASENSSANISGQGTNNGDGHIVIPIFHGDISFSHNGAVPASLQQPTCSYGQGNDAVNTSDKREKNIVFKAVDCSYYVSGRTTANVSKELDTSGDLEDKKSLKPILKDVSFETSNGTLLAIMGPSGSGKSTLLSLLTLLPQNGQPCGNVTLNGNPLSLQLLQQYCAFVPQDDHLWPFLTCREILSFAADFYLSASSSDKKAEVDSLIQELGLKKCENLLCGNQFIKGLSGGQKRRLSLAVALIKKPKVLFLDEPTSGLDSASAQWIMTFLKDYVHKHDVIVICTIHQPSTAIYKQFDSTILLSDGRVAFSGPASQATAYFKQALKTEVPQDYSPAEFILESINSDFGDGSKKSNVNNVLDTWASMPHDLPSYSSPSLPTSGRHAVPFLQQIWIHLRRQSLLAWRDPTLYVSRMAIFLLACIFFAWVYADARSRNQGQVVNRMFLCMWVLAVPTCMGVIAVFAWNQEFLEMKREIKDGMYSAMSFIISNTIMQVPFMVLLALSALGVGPYGIANFHPPNFGLMLVVFSVTLWTFESMAQALSVLFRNPLLGMLVFICLWFCAFLFSGLFITEGSMQWPLKVFMYVLPLRWSLASMIKTEFRDATFDGAALVANPAPGQPEYTCGDGPFPPGFICYGRTGSQVLSSLSQAFTPYEPSQTFGKDMLITFAIGVFFKIVFTALVHLRTGSGKQPAAPKLSRPIRG